MKTRIDKLETLGRAIDQACRISQELELEHLPLLLEMAKLEYLNEVGADLQMRKESEVSRGISSSRRLAH